MSVLSLPRLIAMMVVGAIACTTASAYDPIRKRVVLFSGALTDPPYGTVADTWTWDGAEWTQVTTNPAPSARTGHRMTFDRTRGKILLFGGDGGGYL